MGSVLLLGLCACAPTLELGAAPDPLEWQAAVGPAVLEQLQAATKALGDGRDEGAWRGLGYVYENASLCAPALEAYANAARLSPERPETLFRAALMAGEVGDLDLALDYVERTLQVAPEYGPAHLRRGEWSMELGQLEQARSSILQAAERMPELPDGDLALARLALLEDDLTDALAAIERARQKSPQDAFVRQVLGTALRRSGRLEEALPHLRAGQGSTQRRSDPWSRRVHERSEGVLEEQRAQQQELAGQWEAALAIYERQLATRPGDVRLTIRCGVCLGKLGRHAESLALHQRALGQAPQQYDLRVAYADALRLAGQEEQALEAIQTAIEDWPQRAMAYLAQGNIQSDAGDPLGALESFAQAVRCDPRDLRARFFEGRMLTLVGRWGDAAETLEVGLEAEEQPGMTYFQLLLQAQREAGHSEARIRRTLEAAQRIHGSAAQALVRPTQSLRSR